MELLPPPNRTFDTSDECLQYAQGFAKEQGYALTIKRSKYTTGGEKKELQTAYLQCSKGGVYRRHHNEHENYNKESVSSRTNCPFQASIRRRNEGRTYLFSVTISNHNHEPTLPIALSQHRDLTEQGQALIAHLSKAGVLPQQISSALRLADPDALLIVQDIYNERKRIRRENLAGRSPIEAMVQELQEADYYVGYKVHISGEITHLFFTHPKSVELFQRYPEVILMDCTYKTNRFRMPLLNMVGSTGLGNNFYIAFVFLSAEGEGDYTWALKELKTLMRGEDIPDPAVVVTDRELALMNAVNTVFPMASGLLCEWHISNAVLVKVKKQKTFIKSSGERDVDEEKRFMVQFAEVTSSPSVTIYQQRLAALKESFQQHQELLDYVETVWLGPWFKKCVRAWTDRQLHFGNHTTSRVEGSHSTLKHYLKTSTGDLKFVQEKISLLLTNQHSEHTAAMSMAKNRSPQRLMIPLFTELVGRVTPFALLKILDQYNRLSTTRNTQCHHSLRDSFGLPCQHMIQDRLKEKDILHLHDIHPRWFFTKPTGNIGLIETSQLLLLNPRIVKGKGRPRGSRNRRNAVSSTRREPSAFEIATQEQRRVLRPRSDRVGGNRTRYGTE